MEATSDDDTHLMERIYTRKADGVVLYRYLYSTHTGSGTIVHRQEDWPWTPDEYDVTDVKVDA